MQEDIIIPIIDEKDVVIGGMEKLEVHKKGLLHRAFSIIIKNKKDEFLIHRRAIGKYHSPGLWTNTCCGHPNYGEDIGRAVHRRLKEEMGIESELSHLFTFRYKAFFENGLTENEIDHVYFGVYNGEFDVNPEEVCDFKWLSLEEIETEIFENPELFTVWFKEIMARKKEWRHLTNI